MVQAIGGKRVSRSGGDLPTGAVTLLFSDVEGSTRLLLGLGDCYPAVLEEHRRLLIEAVHAANGQVVDSQGDGMFAAFGRAVDGITAAVQIQRSLAVHPWPGARPLRVRIGLHSGEPRLTAQGYAGLDVHLAARICAAGHGGQILLSRTTSDLIGDGLPAGARLHDLGEHRLRDIPNSQRLMQLLLDDLPAEFPPPRSLYPPSNLPSERRPVIGRDHEVEICRDILLDPETTILTLTGPGGIGKTRLALHLASRLLDSFPDGVYFVPLGAIGDPDLVVRAISGAVGVREAPDRPLLDALIDAFRPRQSLLLFDNMEQLLDAAPLLVTLTDQCPGLKLLVTSREVLRVTGERDFAVPPLALPAAIVSLDAERLTESAATRLFVDRARDAKPDFELTEENVAAVAEICRRLDGLPLAIELAAARVRLLSAPAMAALLCQAPGSAKGTSPFELLSSGPRDLPTRHRTLRSTIAWSHDLLGDQDRALFRRLAVFAGGWTLEAAAALCGTMDPSAGSGQAGQGTMRERDRPVPPSIVQLPLSLPKGPSPVLDGLGSLVDKSLVNPAEPVGSEPRFAMLETIRQFSAEQLDASGEGEAMRLRHAEHFIGLAEAADPNLIGPEQVGWLARLEAEHANLVAALTWLRERVETGDAWAAQAALRLAGSLHWFWRLGGRLREGRNWLRELLSLDMASAEGGTAGRARALLALGSLASIQGEYDEAEALLTEASAIYSELGDHRGEGRALTYLGVVQGYLGHVDRACELCERAVACSRRAGDPWEMAHAGSNLAYWLHQAGDIRGAVSLYEESVVLARTTGDRYILGVVLPKWGNLAISLNELDRAAALHREALSLFRVLRDEWWTSRCLHNLAMLACACDDYQRAAILLGAAEVARVTAGARLSPPEAERDERARRVGERVLGAERFDLTYARGRAMSTGEAVAYALGE